LPEEAEHVWGTELGALGPASYLDWRDGLPLMATSRVLLREPRHADAPALLRLAQAPDIVPHTWPGPQNREQVETFIEWARATRAAGR
jgi:RimJ/RimL family protein N-acetyltransferase